MTAFLKRQFLDIYQCTDEQKIIVTGSAEMLLQPPELQYCQARGLRNSINQRSDLRGETVDAEKPVPHMTLFFPGLIFQVTDYLFAPGKRTFNTKNGLVLPAKLFSRAQKSFLLVPASIIPK